MKTLEEYLAMDWSPITDTVRDGDEVYVRLLVPGVPDFVVYGDSVTEVQDRWREAFASHLAGYLAVGKVIPERLVIKELVTDRSDSTAASGAGEAQPRPHRVELVPA